jgi:Spy/CpxP family protein refolding chaperone
MKRLLFSLFVLFAAVNIASAQQGERGGANQMREMIREQMKKELKATDAQVDSVLAIQQQMMLKMRDIRQDASLSEDQKKAKVLSLTEQSKAKMKTVLNEQQIKKVEEMYENLRKMRQQRQGGQ